MGNYKSSKKRLSEARNHYKSLLNEAPGYPGMCCPQGGPACTSVTFNSANDECSDLGMNDCTHADCQGTPDPSDGPIGITGELTTDNPDLPAHNCTKCDGGYPIMAQVPAGTPCSSLGQGWVDDIQGVDPCGGKPITCDFPTISAACAITADLVNQFVSGNPTQFLGNMATWYANPPGSGTGCDFLEVVRQKHLGHLSTGIAINGNHPNGVQMGPLWIAQKTSKVAYLDCVLADLNAQGCCDGTSTGNGGQFPTGVIQAKLGSNETPKGMDRKGMKI